MEKRLLIIFTRNPELGKVKTRLAKTIGDQAALKIYTTLLQHTANVTQQANCDKAVYYSVKIRSNDLWDNTHFQKHQQEGSDLGLRMKKAFQDAFNNGYTKVMIVGSDLYDLKTSHIEEAFVQLNQNDVVIGPAEDGGYYLLALKSLHKNIFENKNWGTETVLNATLNDLSDAKIHFLEKLNDIDLYEDLKKHDSLLSLI